MKRTAILLLMLAALAGCATTSGSDARVSRSGFDGARIVTVNPHGHACWSMSCTGLDAQWSSKTPTQSVLVVSLFNETRAIVGAQLNVDGKVYDLSNAQPFTNFSDFGAATKGSRKGFIIPTDLIRKIANSQRTWLRVTTTAGNFEDAVIDGQTDSKALHALGRFLVSVEQR